MFSDHTDTVVRSTHFTNANRGDADIERIVMHTAEAPEELTTAENVAHFFIKNARSVSAHYVVDVNSIVGCVAEEDIANHAFGDNPQSIGIELAGRANQTKEQWADAYSKGELKLAAQLVADICKRRGIPVKFLTDDELRARKRGIVSHDAVSRVFGDDIRDDPGPHFPWTGFLKDVRLILNPRQVRFVLNDGEGNEIAHSAPANVGWKSEMARLEAFDDFTRGRRLRELRDDRDYTVRRAKA